MENQIWRHTLGQHPELVNAVAPWQETPIQAAAHVGNRTIAEYLLAAGVRLDICTAAMLGQVDMVRWLLDHGSELRAGNYDNKTPLEVDQQNGHEDVAGLLGR